MGIADIVAVNFNGMLSDPRFSIDLKGKEIVFSST